MTLVFCCKSLTFFTALDSRELQPLDKGRKEWHSWDQTTCPNRKIDTIWLQLKCFGFFFSLTKVSLAEALVSTKLRFTFFLLWETFITGHMEKKIIEKVVFIFFLNITTNSSVCVLMSVLWTCGTVAVDRVNAGLIVVTDLLMCLRSWKSWKENDIFIYQGKYIGFVLTFSHLARQIKI